MTPDKKVKILATLGPATHGIEDIRELVEHRGGAVIGQRLVDRPDAAAGVTRPDRCQRRGDHPCPRGAHQSVLDLPSHATQGYAPPPAATEVPAPEAGGAPHPGDVRSRDLPPRGDVTPADRVGSTQRSGDRKAGAP